MAPQQVVFALVTFLHDLSTAVWVGGLIVLGVAVLPAARRALGMGPQTKKLMDAVQQRLSVLVYVSILGLVVTGILLSNRAPAFEGVFRFGSPYATVLGLKHVLVLAMIAITLYRSLALGRGRALEAQQQKLSAGLLILNMILGIAVLLLTGFAVALRSGPPAV